MNGSYQDGSVNGNGVHANGNGVYANGNGIHNGVSKAGIGSANKGWAKWAIGVLAVAVIVLVNMSSSPITKTLSTSNANSETDVEVQSNGKLKLFDAMSKLPQYL